MNKYLDGSESDTDSEADIDIHEIVRSGTFDDVKEAIAIDRPRLIALKDDLGRCAIHYAAELDKLKIAVFLIAKQANINATDDGDFTALHLAAAKGLTEMCRTLLEFKADIKLRDKNCWTALHHAVEGRYLETATLLVKRGADLNAEDYRYGRTVLHIAAEKGYTEIATMLLIRGADMYASGDQFYSRTPLHLACIHGHTEVARVLVKRGADVAVLSGFLDKNPLHLACENGHWECAEILIKKGMDLDVCGHHINGSTALHICAALNELAILQMLVEHGADIEKQGRFATIGTPLHVACSSGNAHAANLLISLGADRNCREPTGHTPMHFACRSGNYEVAFMLIDLEVDLALRADNNKVAFDYVVVATIKEKMQLAAAVVDARIQARLAAERAAAKAEADRLRREQERLERLRREEEERIRLAVLRTAAFTKALRSVADISGELGALLGVAEEYPDQDINVNIIQPATEFVLDEGFRFAADNEYDMDSLTNTVHSHTTVGTTYAVYQLINSLSDSSALTRASLRGFHEVVHALLQWPGININYQDSNGNTALHNAALIGNRDIVEMLLTAGIKLTTMNHAGKVAANLAKTNFLRELIRNPALLAHQRKYQEGVLDHVFVQKKCRDGLSLSMDEANKVNSFLEYDHNITPEKPGHSPTDGDHSKHAQSSALALTVTGRPEDSPTRSKSKYYKSPSKKGASHPSAVAHPSAAGHVHVHSILKHPEDEISAPPLLVFTPETVPPELSHLFPHAAMNIPAYAMPGVLALPAAQASPNLPGAPQQSGASTAQPQPMAAVTDKYGPVPGAFGGSHADFFFRTPHATQRRHPQEPEFEGRHDGRSGPPLFLDLLTLQQGYLPTAFDTTEEWNEVKDLLWLLGYPHKPQSSTESALQQDSLAVYSGYTQTPDVDKRYYLHRLAVVMNKLQDAFTDSDERQLKLTAAANNDSSESFDIDQETLGIVSGKLPAIPSAVTSPLKGKRNKPASFTAPPMASPVAEIKHALSLETHNRTDIEVAEENKRELQAELSIDWARIPANICRQDVHRLVRFSKLCEEFVILALQLYEPRDYGWPNALTTGEGGYISQALRDNVAYMRYYGFVTTEVEELLLNLVDLGFTACFQDPPTQLEDHTQCKKVGFAEDSHQPETTWKAKTYPKPVRRVPNLFLNPPRYWRLAVDSVYETSEFIKTKAEQGYPLDAVRAHLWAHTGRVVIQQQRERAKQKYFGVHNTPPISIGGSSKVLSSSAVTASSRRLAIKDASQQAVGTSAANAVVQGGYRRWLADLLLSDYEAYFQNQGFRCLGDFEGLTEQDCIQYFPFLKAGDLRRLTKAAPQLTDEIIDRYQTASAV